MWAVSTKNVPRNPYSSRILAASKCSKLTSSKDSVIAHCASPCHLAMWPSPGALAEILGPQKTRSHNAWRAWRLLRAFPAWRAGRNSLPPRRPHRPAWPDPEFRRGGPASVPFESSRTTGPAGLYRSALVIGALSASLPLRWPIHEMPVHKR